MFGKKKDPLEGVDKTFTIYGLHKLLLEQQHVLIAGSTGSGKTTLINGLIVSASINGYSIIICDTKAIDYSRFRICSNVCHANSIPKIKAALASVIKIIETRCSALAALGKNKSSAPPVYVVIDDLAFLIAEEPETILPLITHIANVGRATNVKLILASQYIGKDILNTRLLINITARVAMHCGSAKESRIVIGSDGAEELSKYGECLVNIPDEDIQKYEVPVYSDEDIDRMIFIRSGGKDPRLIPPMKVDFVIDERTDTVSRDNNSSGSYRRSYDSSLNTNGNNKKTTSERSSFWSSNDSSHDSGNDWSSNWRRGWDEDDEYEDSL